MACTRLVLCVSLVLTAGCPAEEDPGDPVASTGSTGQSSDETETETEAGSAALPITDGDDCPGVGMGCGAVDCCAGLECVAGTCDDPSCAPTGEACGDDEDCCGGLCRSDGVCGPMECVPEGGACEDAPCCDDLPCDQNTGLCSSTCAQFEEACEVAEDCCEQACVDGACGALG